jgi:hypothetical protein
MPPRKKADAASNMFEPVPVKRSVRLRGKEIVKQKEAELLAHIARFSTLGEIATLRAQMDTEGLSMTRAVKTALDEQEEMIRQEMEDDVASPNEVDERVRKLKLELLRLGRKPKRSSLFFGPGTRRMSRGRRAMMAAENADLEAALAAENARIQAEAVAAPLALAPVAAVPHNAVMNALAERFGQASLGPRNAIPYVTTKRGVPGYHFNEEGGSRRRPRKTKRSRRKTRSRR